MSDRRITDLPLNGVRLAAWLVAILITMALAWNTFRPYSELNDVLFLVVASLIILVPAAPFLLMARSMYRSTKRHPVYAEWSFINRRCGRFVITSLILALAYVGVYHGAIAYINQSFVTTANPTERRTLIHVASNVQVWTWMTLILAVFVVVLTIVVTYSDNFDRRKVARRNGIKPPPMVTSSPYKPPIEKTLPQS